jgi:signal transduction histidine kinase
MSPASLRWRATLASSVLGAVLCLLFAGATHWLVEDYELILVDEILRNQAEDYSARLVRDPSISLPRTRRLSGYLRRPDGTGDLPAALAALSPGVHESPNEDEDGLHMGVFDVPAGRMVFVVDLTDIERLEGDLEIFLVTIVVFGPLLAGWLGWWLAGASLAPVRSLAAAVERLPKRPEPTRLAELAGNDDLGQLAKAIDDYQQRLVDADARERAFFAEASHDLRTPVAVVQGAAEVLLDEPGWSPSMQRKLQRLDRGMQALVDLLEVLLGVARRSEFPIAPLDVRRLLDESVAALPGEDRARVTVDGAEGQTVQVPTHAATLLLRSLLRRMLLPGRTGRLVIRFAEQRITVEFRPEPAELAGDAGAPRDQSSVGLALLDRLAEQVDWQIDEVAEADGTRRLAIRLPDSAVRAGA